MIDDDEWKTEHFEIRVRVETMEKLLSAVGLSSQKVGAENWMMLHHMCDVILHEAIGLQLENTELMRLKFKRAKARERLVQKVCSVYGLARVGDIDVLQSKLSDLEFDYRNKGFRADDIHLDRDLVSYCKLDDGIKSIETTNSRVRARQEKRR